MMRNVMQRQMFVGGGVANAQEAKQRSLIINQIIQTPSNDGTRVNVDYSVVDNLDNTIRERYQVRFIPDEATGADIQNSEIFNDVLSNGEFIHTYRGGSYTAKLQLIDMSFGQTTNDVLIEIPIDFNFDEVEPPEPNLAPVILSTAPITAVAGELYQYQVIAYDPEGDALSYNVSINPENQIINISDEGLVSWTPIAAV